MNELPNPTKFHRTIYAEAAARRRGLWNPARLVHLPMHPELGSAPEEEEPGAAPVLLPWRTPVIFGFSSMTQVVTSALDYMAERGIVPSTMNFLTTFAEITPYRRVDYLGPSRKQPLTNCRQAMMALCYFVVAPGLSVRAASMPSIGQRLRRDHTTVLHGIRKQGIAVLTAVEAHPEAWPVKYERVERLLALDSTVPVRQE